MTRLPEVPGDVDLYEVLGVPETATADEVKAAYRKLAFELHPDRTGGDPRKEERFKLINLANSVLSDRELRKEYDLSRPGLGPGIDGADGRGPFDFDYSGMDPRAGAAYAAADLLSTFFGAELGSKFRNAARIAVAEAARSGPGAGPDPFGGFAGRTGRGASPGENGGATPGAPPGWEEAEKRKSSGRRAGAGAAGKKIHLDLNLTIDEACFGTEVAVETPAGKFNVKIPPGTSSGKMFVLRPHGVYLTVQIQVPTHLSPRARELLIQFRRETRGSG